jgi:hypothetical protein
MSSSDAGVQSIVDQTARLSSIAQIRDLKARYWANADVGNWAGVAQTLAVDVAWDARYERRFGQGLPLVELEPIGQAIEAGDPAVVVGRDAAIQFMSANMAPFVGFHMGGEPIIDVLGHDSARGIWPFFDHLQWAGRTFRGYGHYTEEYTRVDGLWLISVLRMTRVARDTGFDDYPIKLNTRED